jgi:hypothetical protein
MMKEMAMRDDMYKVIVERPRKKPWATPKTARAYRNSEDAPPKLGIKKGYISRKWLNENLNPLKRWLESQVNRPWDKVYAELCENIDRRNTVQEHIFAHIDSFVELETQLVDGKVFVLQNWPTHLVPLAESRATLYVHPKTRILLKNKQYMSWARRQQQSLVAEEAKRIAVRRELSETEQLHRLNGIWFHVTLATMAEVRHMRSAADLKELPARAHWDVVHKQWVSRAKSSGEALYSTRYVYAQAKRQLSKAELKRYGLTNAVDDDNEVSAEAIATNKNAGATQRFFFVTRNETYSNLCAPALQSAWSLIIQANPNRNYFSRASVAISN